MSETTYSRTLFSGYWDITPDTLRPTITSDFGSLRSSEMLIFAEDTEITVTADPDITGPELTTLNASVAAIQGSFVVPPAEGGTLFQTMDASGGGPFSVEWGGFYCFVGTPGSNVIINLPAVLDSSGGAFEIKICNYMTSNSLDITADGSDDILRLGSPWPLSNDRTAVVGVLDPTGGVDSLIISSAGTP